MTNGTILDMRIMSIGANCADISILGDYRERGPVDNWRVEHGIEDAVTLFTGEFEKMVKEDAWLEVKHKNPTFKGDGTKRFIYKTHQCFHIEMDNPEVKEKVLNRLQHFYDFIEEVKTKDDCYFCYVVAVKDQVKNGVRAFSDKFYENLDILSKYIPLNKLIIIGTPKEQGIRSYFSAFSKEGTKGKTPYTDVKNVAFAYQDKKNAPLAFAQFKGWVENELCKSNS